MSSTKKRRSVRRRPVRRRAPKPTPRQEADKFLTQMVGFGDLLQTAGKDIGPAVLDALEAWRARHPEAARTVDRFFNRTMRSPKTTNVLAALTAALSEADGSDCPACDEAEAAGGVPVLGPRAKPSSFAEAMRAMYARPPRPGEPVIYVLNKDSERPGEERLAFVTRVLEGLDQAVELNVQVAPGDFADLTQVPGRDRFVACTAFRRRNVGDLGCWYREGEPLPEFDATDDGPKAPEG